MLHINARNSKGFTLIEVLVVMIIIGIMSAIAAPSFMGMLNRNRVSNTAIRLKSALTEAQVNATRLAKTCNLSVVATNPIDSTTLTSPSGGCWRTGADEFSGVSFSGNSPSGVKLRIASVSPTTTLAIGFDFKGRVTNSVVGTSTMILSLQNSTDGQGYERCVKISYPLGLVNMGTYTNSTSTCDIDP